MFSDCHIIGKAKGEANYSQIIGIGNIDLPPVDQSNAIFVDLEKVENKAAASYLLLLDGNGKLCKMTMGKVGQLLTAGETEFEFVTPIDQKVEVPEQQHDIAVFSNALTHLARSKGMNLINLKSDLSKDWSQGLSITLAPGRYFIKAHVFTHPVGESKLVLKSDAREISGFPAYYPINSGNLILEEVINVEKTEHFELFQYCGYYCSSTSGMEMDLSDCKTASIVIEKLNLVAPPAPSISIASSNPLTGSANLLAATEKKEEVAPNSNSKLSWFG